MKTTDNTAANAVQEIRDRGLLPADATSAAFSTYTAQRDELSALPYFPNRMLAQEGTAFTVERATVRSKRIAEGFSREGEVIETFVYLVKLQGALIVADRTTGEVTSYAAGTRGLIEFDRLEGNRKLDFDTMNRLTAKSPVTNVSLQEYPSKRGTQYNSTGLIAATAWRPVHEVKPRGDLSE